jgi:hypothetical protein
VKARAAPGTQVLFAERSVEEIANALDKRMARPKNV